MNYDQIYQDFVGKEKIQAISVTRKKKDENIWILQYKENNKTASIECESRDDLDKILVEFGGKNPETCKAESRFLELDFSWDSESLNELGHRITKIELLGQRSIRDSVAPFPLPKGTGSQNVISAKRKKEDVLKVRYSNAEKAKITRAFNKRTEFDEFLKFIMENETLKELKWFVNLIGTESRDTGDHCVWKRVKAGDGTKRMVLELVKINGKSFQKCVRKDVFDAAGDMFDSVCQRITLRKKKPPEQDYCGFSLEDRKKDISGYEVAV